MSDKLVRVAFSLVIFLIPLSGNADVTFNGFGSIVTGVTFDQDETLFNYDNKISLNPESRLALQASSDLGNGFSVTAQVVGRGENNFDANLEWAFISFQTSDSDRLNLGRIRIPFFQYSDFLDVGYAYPWIRPPAGAYGALGFSTMDGVSWNHQSVIGTFDSTIQAVYGRYTGDLTLQGQDIPSELIDLFGASWSLSRDWLTTRVGYYQTSVFFNSPDLAGLGAQLESVGQSELAELMTIQDDLGWFGDVFVGADFDQYFAAFEWVTVKVEDSIISQYKGYYLTLGTRIDKNTFDVTYSNGESEAAFSLAGYPTLPAPFVPGIQSLIDSQIRDYSEYSLGWRYEIHDSAALKLEFTIRDDQLGNADVKLLSASIDFLF